MEATTLKEEPFPAPSKTAKGQVGGVETEASSIQFADKILLTLSQDGRLSQWIQVPLSAPSPASLDMPLLARASGPGGPSSSGGALPMTHLTAKTLLGGGGESRESLGHVYAAHIASHLSLRDPEDRRTLVLGLGLRGGEEVGAGGGGQREQFFDVLDLVLKVL